MNTKRKQFTDAAAKWRLSRTRTDLVHAEWDRQLVSEKASWQYHFVPPTPLDVDDEEDKQEEVDKGG